MSDPVELNDVEARVLGVLVEKAFLTPDVYPMTTNAMVTACNQKTNRDPVVSYSAVDVDAALMDMRQRGLVRRVHMSGARSTKHRHTLDEVLDLDDYQIAVLSVLLLRGAQTVGELRQRTERHVGFEDLESVESCLQSMAERAMVEEQPRRPGQKENRWVHLLGDGSQPAVSPTPPAPEPTREPSPPAPSAPATSARAAVAPEPRTPAPAAHQAGADADLVSRVRELETEVETLRRQLASLASKLGEPLD